MTFLYSRALLSRTISFSATPFPADCLPPEVLESVIEKIRDANELLLDLALADERPPEETFQKVFDGLVGLRVEITNQLGETIEGRVTLAGFNFVVLQEEEIVSILPYSQIETIKPLAGLQSLILAQN